MSGDSSNEQTQVVNDNENPTVETEGTQETTSGSASAEDVAQLKAAIEKQEALIEKLRQHEQKSLEAEKAAKREKQTEVERVTELYEQKLNSLALNASLENELTKAGVRNVEVARKVLDTASIDVVDGNVNKQAVRDAVAALKESEAYLFKTAESSETTVKPTSKPGRPAEGPTEDVVQKEIKAAKSVKELNAVLAKYNVGAK